MWEELTSWSVDAFWAWLAIGLLLMILELATGSLFLVWPGLAAFVVMLIVYFTDALPVHWQLVIFAVISVAMTYLGRSYFKDRVGAKVSDRPLLNKRNQQLVGRKVWAIDAFNHGEGRVRLGDSQWSARLDEIDGVDAPAEVAKDAPLSIIRVEGALLIVRLV